MTMSTVAALLHFVSLLSAVAAVKLNEDNYERLTNGKTVFLNFCDPMDRNCIRMENAWEELSADYESSKSKLIGEIDCTVEMSLCEAEGIDDFPALRWGSIYDLQEYGGPRDYSNLKKFAETNLKPICGPSHMSLCDKATRKEIRRLQTLTRQQLDAELLEMVEEQAAMERNLEAASKDFQAQYDKALETKDAAKNEILDSGLPIMKAVLQARKAA